MKSRIILLSLLALSVAQPLKETSVNDETAMQNNITELNNLLLNVAYKKNIKDILMQYILSEYKDLTFTERDKVHNIIEEFLQDLAKDLSSIFNSNGTDTEDIVIRVEDPTFDAIRKFIRLELPDVDERNAVKLAYRLQENLISARQKIEKVINDSKIALMQNSSR